MSAPTTLTAGVPTEQVGDRLRRARRDRGLTRTRAAELAGIPIGTLGRYERGAEPVPDDELERLAACYGTSVGRMIPTRATRPVERHGRTLRVGGSSRDLPSEHPTPGEVLAAYRSILVELRRADPGDELPLRADDLAALAEILGERPEADGLVRGTTAIARLARHEPDRAGPRVRPGTGGRREPGAAR